MTFSHTDYLIVVSALGVVWSLLPTVKKLMEHATMSSGSIQAAQGVPTPENEAMPAPDPPAMPQPVPAPPAPSPAPIMSLTPHPAVMAAVATAQANNPGNWADEAATYLQAFAPFIQAAEQLSNAGSKTQGWIALSEAALPMLAGMLGAIFQKPVA